MRSVKFREILWGVAYKMGLEPSDTSNFLTNQAVPIGTYIDQWVRRTYDARDWPELVITRKFAPSSHIVPWDGDDTIYGERQPYHIGRVLKVYLLDPRITDAPVDTDFTLLTTGIHCGYEHGTHVWIRYMSPPPRFTAELWQADITYSIDDVVYSYRTGECYRSRSNGNQGNDPARSFQPPPLPPEGDVDPPVSETPPTVEVIQAWVPDSSGAIERPKITDIVFAYSNLASPPPANTFFSIVVIDEVGVSLSTVTHTANGTDTLATIINTITTALETDLIPEGFTVTPDTTNLRIRLEDLSNFGFDPHTVWVHQPDGVTFFFKFVEIQSYIPSLTYAPGVPQITRITINAESTIPGAIYHLTIRGSDGVEHTVEFESSTTDDTVTILAGITNAIEASADAFFDDVSTVVTPSAGTLDIYIKDNTSTDAVIELQGDPFWELTPFPRVLADQAMRGGCADLLKEWGQTDKGMAEEQAVPAEQAIAEGDFTTTPNPPLSGQQRAMSRYRL